MYLCMRVCLLCICLPIRVALCAPGRQPRCEEKNPNCVKLMYSAPRAVRVSATETLLAVHDSTLAVGAVNGVHTLFSPRWSGEWVCGERQPAARWGWEVQPCGPHRVLSTGREGAREGRALMAVCVFVCTIACWCVHLSALFLPLSNATFAHFT